MPSGWLRFLGCARNDIWVLRMTCVEVTQRSLKTGIRREREAGLATLRVVLRSFLSRARLPI